MAGADQVHALIRKGTHGSHGNIAKWGLGLTAAYALVVSHVVGNDWAPMFSSVDEIYSVSGLILGILFGCYSSFVMTRWWDLRVATGSVAGGLVNIAVVLRGYLRCVPSDSVPADSIREIQSDLRSIYMHHLSDVLRVTTSPQDIGTTDSMFVTQSRVLAHITELTQELPFSDAVKFSLLPAVQADLLSVKSHAGDACMILNCRYPRIFSYWMYFFLGLHLLYLPVYMMSKVDVGSNSIAYYLVTLIGFGVIVGFALLVETHFRNPFRYNDFKLHDIASGTLKAVDELLDLKSVTKVKKTSSSLSRRTK